MPRPGVIFPSVFSAFSVNSAQSLFFQLAFQPNIRRRPLIRPEPAKSSNVLPPPEYMPLNKWAPFRRASRCS